MMYRKVLGNYNIDFYGLDHQNALFDLQARLTKGRTILASARYMGYRAGGKIEVFGQYETKSGLLAGLDNLTYSECASLESIISDAATNLLGLLVGYLDQQTAPRKMGVSEPAPVSARKTA